LIILEIDVTEEQLKRFSEALARLSGDEELLVAMASMVVDDAPIVINELQCHLDQKALPEAAGHAHKLKGMCSTFETGSPVVELEDVIHAARAGKLDDACETFNRCKPQIKQLINDIAELKA
jgi:hypothetical protein